MTTTQQPRRARGVPIAGAYDFFNRPASAAALSGFSFHDAQQRSSALQRFGFENATSTAATVRSTAARWWDAAYVRAEHQVGGAGFSKMTDFWNPDGTTRSTRLRRTKYAGGGVELMMPSVSAIRKKYLAKLI